MEENRLAAVAVDLCFKIHKRFGPGLFESVYESIFCHEWEKTGIEIWRQRGVRVIYDEIDMGIGFIPDLVLGGKLILELKSVDKIAEVHHKQLLTYLRLTNIKLGLLINFNVPLIKDGITRLVNNL